MTVFESVYKYIKLNTKFKLFTNVIFICDAITAAFNSNFGIVSKCSLIRAKIDLPTINAQVIEFDDLTLRKETAP